MKEDKTMKPSERIKDMAFPFTLASIEDENIRKHIEAILTYLDEQHEKE